MRINLLHFLLLLAGSISAQALTVTDVTLFRGAVQESPYAIIADAEDNVYLAASHYLGFLYDPDEAPLPGAIGRSGAVIKRDAEGNTVWAYEARYAGEGDCESVGCFGYTRQLALRPNGAGVYVGLDFGSPLDVDNGPGTVLVNDGIAVVQLDGSGDYQNAYRFTSTLPSNNINLYGIITDETGNLYISGTYRSALNIDTGTDVVSLPRPEDVSSLDNGFIGRISPEGTIDWIHNIALATTSGFQGGLAYRNGELHWMGAVRNAVDFDPSPVILRSNLRSNFGNFVARYDTEGRVISLFTFADREDAGFVRSMKLGVDGKYYGIGVNHDNINLTADDSTSPTINSEGWIASWRQDGSLRWFQEYADTRSPSFDVDAGGIVYVSASADVDIDIPGPSGTISLTPGSTEISFLQSVSHEGFLSDPIQLISSWQTRGIAVGVSPTGRVHWTGTYRGELTDPTGVITASEDIDIFLVTLDGATPVATQDRASDVSPTLFPNPADDQVNVADLNYSEVIIIDGFGRAVRRSGSGPISTIGLPAGAYFVQLRTEAGWATGRFLKR